MTPRGWPVGYPPLSCYCVDHCQLNEALSFVKWSWLLSCFVEWTTRLIDFMYIMRPKKCLYFIEINFHVFMLWVFFCILLHLSHNVLEPTRPLTLQIDYSFCDTDNRGCFMVRINHENRNSVLLPQADNNLTFLCYKAKLLKYRQHTYYTFFWKPCFKTRPVWSTYILLHVTHLCLSPKTMWFVSHFRTLFSVVYGGLYSCFRRYSLRCVLHVAHAWISVRTAWRHVNVMSVLYKRVHVNPHLLCPSSVHMCNIECPLIDYELTVFR
jgi:hypothetical protein